MLWQFEKSPEPCLVFLVYELPVRAEEEVHLLPLLSPGAQPPFQPFSFLPAPSSTHPEAELLPSSDTAFGAFGAHLPLWVGNVVPYPSLGAPNATGFSAMD